MFVLKKCNWPSHLSSKGQKVNSKIRKINCLQIAEAKKVQQNAMELQFVLKNRSWHLGKLNFDHPST